MRSWQLHRLFLALLLLGDAGVVTGSFFAAWWIRFGSGLMPFSPPAPPVGAYVSALPFSVVAWLTVLNYAGAYQRRSFMVGYTGTAGLIKVAFAATLVVFAAGFLYRGFSYSRLVLAIMAVLNVVLLRGGRGVLQWAQVALRRRGVGVIRIAIVGDGPEARAMAATLRRHPGYGYRVAGYVGRRPPSGDLAPRLGSPDRFRGILARVRPDEVLLAPPRSASRDEVADAVLACRQAGVACRMFADVYGLVTSRLMLEDLFGLPVLSLEAHPLTWWGYRAIKRAVDVTLAGLALVLLSPVLAVVALVVKLDSPGPMFYGQERVGRDGRTFRMLKFRSMRADAERKSGPVWARKDDPRRTRSGAFLRRTSLDELPQILNVLRGDMSLVGPRPERPHFVDAFSREVPRYRERHGVAPGITGWAQVNGLRGDTSIEERTRYDLFYIEHWSMGLDLRIIFRTAMEVFHHQEAY